MRIATILSVALALTFGAVAPAWAQLTNNTFTDQTESHAWDNGSNWSDGIPNAEHNAIIGSDKTCYIYTNGSDGVAGAFAVAGQLTVQGSRKLTISHDSVVDGLVKLDYAGKLVINDHLTIRSNNSGVIRLDGVGEFPAEIKNNGGNEVLTITNTCVNDEETCSVDIRGLGKISVALVNDGAVIGDYEQGGCLELASSAKLGDGGVWGAEAGGCLSVQVGVSGAADWRIISTDSAGDYLSEIWIAVELTSGLCGDVYLEDGTFHAEESFCTSGNLTWKSVVGYNDWNTAPFIQVDSGAYTTARFKSSTCGCTS